MTTRARGMDQRLAAADAALKEGRRSDAVTLLVAHLTEKPTEPARVYRALGNALWHLERFEEGAVWTAKALQIWPRDYELLNFAGIFLRRTGRYAEALKALEEAQKIQPRELTPLVNKGNVYNDIKNGPAAEAIFTKLARLQPRVPEHFRGLGRALWHQGKLDAAASRFKQAIALKKDYVDAWLDLAGLEADRSKIDTSMDILDRALLSAPDNPRLLEARPQILRQAGRPKEAVAHLKHLLDRYDNSAWVHSQLARSIADYDRPNANIHFRRALELDPDNTSYRIALAESLERTRQGNEGENIEEAYQTLRPALDGRPLTPGATKVATEVLVRVAEYEAAEAIGSFETLGREWALSNRHTSLLKQLARARTHEDRIELLHQHKIWGDLAIGKARQNPVTRRPRPDTRKIRLGFMSSDLRAHPVAYFAWPLFEHADRERFEIYCYSFFQGESADATQTQISNLVDQFRWKPDITDRDAAQMIADDSLDILLELGGSTHMNKIEVMAYKPARIGVSWLGYPHSAGLTTIDYLLVDPFLRPERPELLLETPLEMPQTWIALGKLAFPDTHRINPIAPHVRTGMITFGTANNPYKYSPEMLQTWARVVREVPGSRFLFVRPEGGSETFRRNIRGIFSQNGVPPERVIFNAVRGAHMPVYNDIDIALDTFPQTGGTTTCEAAWMGVPTVTKVGEALYERLSYSILSNSSLQDLCARTDDEFVSIAVQLAGDTPRIQELRTGLRDRLKESPLGQTEKFAADFYNLMANTVKKRIGAPK